MKLSAFQYALYIAHLACHGVNDKIIPDRCADIVTHQIIIQQAVSKTGYHTPKIDTFIKDLTDISDILDCPTKINDVISAEQQEQRAHNLKTATQMGLRGKSHASDTQQEHRYRQLSDCPDIINYFDIITQKPNPYSHAVDMKILQLYNKLDCEQITRSCEQN